MQTPRGMASGLALLVMIVAASGAGAHQTGMAAKSKLSAADRKFVKEAAQGGVSEVVLGQLAAKQGANASVKAFGQHMVSDHSQANVALVALAKQKGIAIKQEIPDADKPLKAKLSGLHGAAFDRAYRKAMIEDHEKDVAEFAKEAKSGSDPDVKKFAATTLPTLREHLQRANAMLISNTPMIRMGAMHHSK